MTVYAAPYVPSLVPQSEDIKDIERYLADEMARIAIALEQVSVQAAYGGLVVSIPGTGTADIAPSQLTDFDGFTPAEPNRVIAVPPGYNALIPQESGVFMAMAQFTVEIDAGRVYRITLAKDGVLGPVFGEYDTSNQTNSITMTFAGLVEIQRGEEITVWVNSDQNGSKFNVQNGIFMIFRVSEYHAVRT